MERSAQKGLFSLALCLITPLAGRKSLLGLRALAEPPLVSCSLDSPSGRGQVAGGVEGGPLAARARVD